jgi:hypothetical protein
MSKRLLWYCVLGVLLTETAGAISDAQNGVNEANCHDYSWLKNATVEQLKACGTLDDGTSDSGSTAGATSPQQTPTLVQTISFINNSVAPEDGFVTSVNDCELYFTRNSLFSFALPTGTYVKSTDQFGVAHYGIHWMVVEESPRVYRFRLAEIDPTSINSKPVPSVAFVKDHGDNLKELKDPDLDLVTFDTANEENAIEVGHFEEGANGPATPVFERKAASEMLVFQSKDRAERFVTAFIHAVQLCGGKGDLFAPTPSHPYKP